MKEAEREDIENDSDVDFHFLIANEREIRLYDVQDIQKELEELTEDE